MRAQRDRDPFLPSREWIGSTGLAPLISQRMVGNRGTHASVTSMGFESIESSLASDLGAQHEAVHQVIYVRNRHLSGSAEQQTIEQLRKESSLPLSDANRTRSRQRVPRQPCLKVRHSKLSWCQIPLEACEHGNE